MSLKVNQVGYESRWWQVCEAESVNPEAHALTFPSLNVNNQENHFNKKVTLNNEIKF